jgi:transposase
VLAITWMVAGIVLAKGNGPTPQRKDRSAGASLPQEKRQRRQHKNKKNYPQFDLREQLFRTGTDLTQIDGIDVLTAMTVVGEGGWDMSKWPSEHHFVSWLRLSPDNRVSGDRVIGKGRLPTNNRLNVILRMAAISLRQSDSYWGGTISPTETEVRRSRGD